jgi:dTDP-glucose pyrophosphorylase
MAKHTTTRARKSRDLTRLLVPPDATLLHAMRVIDQGAIELAFVADASGRVLGTLSDGDVRRAILGGMPLDAPTVHAAMNRTFKSVRPETGRAEVLDLMRALTIDVVPVLEDGVMVGLHLLHELIGAEEKPNAAVLMAGGKGVRLQPLTYDTPKPMLPVAGRPILERLVLQLVGSGIRRIYIAVNYLGHVIERHFENGRRFGCRIEYLRETRALGTAGPLSLLPKGAAKEPMLVMNGDLVTEFNVARLLQFHARGDYALTTCLKPYVVDIPFGVADVQGDALTGMREKPQQSHLVNTGIYVVGERALRLVPKDKESTMPELIERCMKRKLGVGAFQLEGDWIDVGRHETLKQARGEK